jgi:hypothetical protein
MPKKMLWLFMRRLDTRGDAILFDFYMKVDKPNGWREAATTERRTTARVMEHLAIRIMKLVGMSRAFSGRLRDLGLRALGGVSGRVDVVVAGGVDAMIFGHDREETLAGLAGSRS